MARVLLVNPPFYRILGSHYNGMSLGLSYIASSLIAEGHDAWVYNADFDPDPRYKTLHQIFEDFGHEPLDFSIDNPIIRECLQNILDFRADWVGYACYTATVPVIRSLTTAVWAFSYGVRQVVGGPHCTLDPAAKQSFPFADYVVRGEGERVMSSLVGGTEPDEFTVQGERIADLDSLPFPDRKHFWATPAPDLSYLSTARGCPWRCAYCASPEIWPRVHSRSPESVLEEVRGVPRPRTAEMQQNGDLVIQETSLYIIDDTFTFSAPRAIQIMQGLDRPWKCEARADTITRNVAQAMSETGCVRAKVGVESGSERILKQIGKGETKDDIRRGISLLQEFGVPVTIYLMAGFPGETDDDLRKTIEFGKELQPDYCSISMVAPYYGTRLYRDFVAAGGEKPSAPWQCFFHHNDSMLLNRNLSRGLIEELWALCDVGNYG